MGKNSYDHCDAKHVYTLSKMEEIKTHGLPNWLKCSLKTNELIPNGMHKIFKKNINAPHQFLRYHVEIPTKRQLYISSNWLVEVVWSRQLFIKYNSTLLISETVQIFNNNFEKWMFSLFSKRFEKGLILTNVTDIHWYVLIWSQHFSLQGKV